jgi:hypothetical protein
MLLVVFTSVSTHYVAHKCAAQQPLVSICTFVAAFGLRHCLQWHTVKENALWFLHELHSNSYSPDLATRDALDASLGIANECVLTAFQTLQTNEMRAGVCCIPVKSRAAHITSGGVLIILLRQLLQLAACSVLTWQLQVAKHNLYMVNPEVVTYLREQLACILVASLTSSKPYCQQAIARPQNECHRQCNEAVQ